MQMWNAAISLRLLLFKAFPKKLNLNVSSTPEGNQIWNKFETNLFRVLDLFRATYLKQKHVVIRQNLATVNLMLFVQTYPKNWDIGR